MMRFPIIIRPEAGLRTSSLDTSHEWRCGGLSVGGIHGGVLLLRERGVTHHQERRDGLPYRRPQPSTEQPSK